MIEGRKAKKSDSDASAVDEAKDYLRDVLKDGRQLCNDVAMDADLSGITKKTLRNAREALGVVTYRTGFGQPGYWELPKGQQ